MCVCVCQMKFLLSSESNIIYKKINKQGITLSSEVYLNISEQMDELKFCLRSSPLSAACSLLMASFNLFLRALFLARAPPTRLLVSTTASSLPVEKKAKEGQAGQRSRGAGQGVCVWSNLSQRKKFWFVPWKWSEVKVVQSCPTLCDSMHYIVHGILQARMLEWVAYPFSSGSSWPRNQTGVSCIAGGFFINWAISEAPCTMQSSVISWIWYKHRMPILESGISVKT